MTLDTWLATHSYLQPLATLQNQVNTAMGGISTTRPAIPRWDNYSDDFYTGVPLLQSPKAGIDLEPAEGMITLLIEKLATSSLPKRLAEESKALDAELRHEKNALRQVLVWLICDVAFPCSYPGLLRYLGWLALSQYLRPVVEAFGKWREEERWLRSYCPTCGSLPAMAQLAATDPARRRFLLCGRCATRWCYRRTGCPFCENQNDHRLAALTIEGEAGLRIDYCESCSGYLKTYVGEGNESVLLADWTSIHLDVISQDRGLKRLAASLYEL
jgi:FdhE protein